MPTRTLLFRSATTVVAVGALFASAPALFAQSAVSIPRSAGGAPAGRLSDHPSLSADGRYVAFQSDSEDLVPRDGNGACDIFIYDNFTGFSELVSTGPGLLRADGDSMHPALSADGRFVAFASDATNLVAPWMRPGVIEDVFDSNGVRDVFVFDRVEKRLLPVSVTNDGRLANGDSDHPALSSDGRFVVFQSRANNLGAESGGRWQVYRHDLLTRETTLVSMDARGQAAPGDNTDPVVSADGATIAFVSTGALVPHDTNGQRDVYIRRGPLADVVLASVSSDGAPGNASSAAPSLSADGARLAFESGASNLVPGDTNQVRDVFVRDFTTGLTRRVTADVMTGQNDAPSGSPAISGDGRRVAMATVATMNVRGMEGLAGLSSVVVVDLESESVMLPSVGVARQQPMDFGAPALNGLGDEVIFVGYSPIVNPEQGPRAEGLFRGLPCGPDPTITINYEVMDIAGMDPTDTGSVGAMPTVIAMKIGEELCLDINAVIAAGCAAADSLVLDQVAPPVIPPLPASRTTFFNGMTCAAPGAMTTLPIGAFPANLDTINAIMKFESNPEDQNDPAAGEYQLRLTLTEIDGAGNPVRVLLRTINVSVATCDEPRFDEQGLQDFDFCFDDDPIMDDRFTAAASGSPTDPGSAFFRMYPGETVTYAFGFTIGERCDTMDDDTGFFVRAQNEVTDCPLPVDPRCTLGFDLLPDQISIVGISFDVVGTGLIVLTPGDFPANPFPIDPADYAGFGVDADLVRQINIAFQIAPTVDDVGTTVVRWEFLDSTGESNEVETVIQVFDCPTPPICELLCFERTCDVPGTTPIEREEYPCKPVNDPCDEDGMGSTFEVVPSASGAAFSFRVRARYPGLQGDDQNCACDGGTVRLEIVDAEEGAPSLMFVGGVALPCPQMDGDGPAPTCDTPMMDAGGQFIVKTLADESEFILACVSGVALNGQARPEPYRYTFRVTDEDTGLFSECCVDIVVCPPPVCDVPLDLITVDGESPIVNMDGSVLVLPGQKLLFTATATTDCRSLGLSLDEFGSTRDTDGAGMMAPIAFDPFPAMNPNCTVVSTVPPTGPPAALPVSISEECGATGPRTISATATCTFDETFAGDIVVLRFRATDSCGRTVSDCDLTLRFAVPPECEIKNTDECPAVERISVSPGDTVTFDVNFMSDVLSDLNWSVTGLPDGADLTPPPPPAPPAMGAFIPSPASTHFEWTPTEGDKGIYTLTFTVMDEFGQVSDPPCIIEIEVCNPPVITIFEETPFCDSTERIQAIAGEQVSFKVGIDTDCRDLDLSNPNDGLDITWTAQWFKVIGETLNPVAPPGNAAFMPAPGAGLEPPIMSMLMWTPTTSDKGMEFVVRITATDECLRSAVRDVAIAVCNPPTCEIVEASPFCAPLERIEVIPGQKAAFTFISSAGCDDKTLTWSVTGLPAGKTGAELFEPDPPAMGALVGSMISSDFSWTPDEGDKGSYTITLTATDECGRSTMCSIDVTVCNPPTIDIAEQAPFCDSTGRIQASAGQEVSFKVAIDTDCTGEEIKWAVEWFKGETPIQPPTGAVFMPAPSGAGFVAPPIMAMFTWIPGVADKDMIYSVRITAMDECGKMSSRDITIAVCNPPTCVIADIVPEPCPSTGRVEVEPGDTVMFDFRTTAGCSDKQVSWCVTGLPASKNINDVFEPDPPCGGLVNAPLESLFTWTPGPEDKGVHTITITVTDECGREMECDVEIAVCNPPSCEFSMESPVCDAAGGVNASPGQQISFKIDFLAAECSDEDLTYTVEGLPDGASLMPPAGTTMAPPYQVMFTWTPDAGDKGDHTIRFLVEDECGREGDCEITVGVCNPPVCEIRDVNKEVCADGSLPGVYLLHPGQKFEATLFASSECEVNRLNWSTAFCLDGVSIETPSGVTLNPVPPLPGVFEAPPVSSLFCWTPTDDHVSDDVYTFKFMVEDECGRQSLCEIDILVCPEPVCRIFNVDILDASMMVVEEIDPFEENCSAFEDPIRLMIGETLRFDFCAQAFCPCGDPEISYSISPDPTQFDEPGTISFPDPAPVGDELCSTFEWAIGEDVVGVYEITFTVTDSLDKPPVTCCIKIFIPSPCIEDCENDTDTCERAYFIDPNEGECGPYFSGLLEPSIAPGCEPDTYLVLFDKFVQYVNENDNSSMVGNGKASALYGVTTANGLINDGAGNLSLRVGVTGYPDGRIRPFEGLAQNGPHLQMGEFELKITFKDAGGNPILNGVIMPQGYPYVGPTIYRDEFITGMEAFKLSFQAPAGTVSADVEIDNTVGEREVCNDVDFIRYINLVPLCEYCITQTGGLDDNCEPANIRIGWFDKDCEEAILSDCDSGPFGQAQICVVADNNGVIVIGVTGCDDEDFDGLSDAPMPFIQRAPPVCPDPPPGHGVCACYTICILPNQPHPLTGESALASSEFLALGRAVSGRSVEDLRDALRAADLNMDGACDTADLGILMSNWQGGQAP